MAAATKKRKSKKIPVGQVENQLVEGLQQGDVDRQVGISGMARIKRTKLVNVRRERGRLETKHSKDSLLIMRLDRQMVIEHRQMVDARMEEGRICIKPLERKAGRWQLHGHVRDADGHPMEKQKVSLYQNEKMSEKPLATATTDSKGYYKFDQAQKAKAKKGLRVNKPQPTSRVAIYIGVQDRTGKIVHRECRPVRAAAGGVSYRDIKVNEITRTGSENYPTRLLGNSNSRELHDLNNEKKNCFISKIRPDHRIYYRTIDQAQKAGYDFCAQCFSKKASKR